MWPPQVPNTELKIINPGCPKKSLVCSLEGRIGWHGSNLAFLLAWVHPPQMSKGLNSRQTRNNAPVIKFETKIQQRHVFAARKQIAFSLLSHFFSPKQNILLWNMSNLQYLLSLYLITGKGLLDFCWFLHFLLKFLRGFWGNLISKKRRRKKNRICIPQALLMEETCCLFKSIFWWERPSSRVPEPSSDSFSWLCFLLRCLQSSEFLVLSFLLKMELGCMLHCRAGRKANIMKCPSAVFCTHALTYLWLALLAALIWQVRTMRLVVYIPWD